MKITVEVNPEDLAIITEQVMKAAGPEAMTKIWMAIGNQIADKCRLRCCHRYQRLSGRFSTCRRRRIRRQKKNRDYFRVPDQVWIKKGDRGLTTTVAALP